MNLKKLAKDIVQRFDAMDEKDQLSWLLETSTDELVIFPMTEFDAFFAKKCNGKYSAFFQWLQKYGNFPNALENFSLQDKWACINETCQEMDSENHLIEIAKYNCCLLFDVEDINRCLMLGYSQKEAEKISKVIKGKSEDYLLDIWEDVAM